MKKGFNWGTFLVIGFIVLLLVFIGIRFTGADNGSEQDGKVNIEHVHGLGYSKDGQKLMVAAHDGLKI